MEKQNLNTTVIYILSVASILCCCFAGLGVIPAGIAYYIAQGKMKEAELNPENYENIDGMKTAKTVATVVLMINIAYLLWTIYRISTIGWDEILEQSHIQMEQYGFEVEE